MARLSALASGAMVVLSLADVRGVPLPQEARSYMDEHQLMFFMSQLIEDLIRNKPSNPWDYIDSYLSAKRLMPPLAELRKWGHDNFELGLSKLGIPAT